jgi:hypothetical protein
VTQAVSLKAIGREGVPILTYRTAFVVITAQGPLRFVVIRLVGTQINHPSSAHVIMNEMQDQVMTEVGVSGYGVHLQSGIGRGELQQVCRDGIRFVGIR